VHRKLAAQRFCARVSPRAANRRNLSVMLQREASRCLISEHADATSQVCDDSIPSRSHAKLEAATFCARCLEASPAGGRLMTRHGALTEKVHPQKKSVRIEGGAANRHVARNATHALRPGNGMPPERCRLVRARLQAFRPALKSHSSSEPALSPAPRGYALIRKGFW
jgi:hypothetical protein